MSTPYSRHEVLAAAKLVDVQVVDMPLPRVIARSVRHYQQRNPDKPPIQLLEAPPMFVERLCVNWLRHVGSNYDAHRDFLRDIADRQLRAEAGAVLKGRVLAQIARSYPVLATEAKRQSRWEDAKPQRV